jgi:TRAP transporter 4TM/12TM fusion protein
MKAKFVLFIGAGISLYHLFFLGKIFHRLGIYISADQHHAISLGFIVFLLFSVYPAKGAKSQEKKLVWYDMLLGLGALVSCVYRVVFPNLVVEHFLNSAPSVTETLLAIILFVALMEGVRRVIGIYLPILVAVFVTYVFISGHLPGFLNARAIGFSEAVNMFYLGNNGIFGMAVEVYSTVIFAFVIFSSFVQVSGAGDFFIDLSLSLFGSRRGGPAKVAVVASALFGTISGSGPANVAATGAVTIPLMKRMGFKPAFAGAVEAVASNGGNVMPPVMGIVAFFMAEIIGVSYLKIAEAAILPSILYFVVLFVAVHLQTAKLGIKGLSREQLPSLKQTLQQGWHHLIPILALVPLLLVFEVPPEIAALWAAMLVIPASMLRRKTRVGPRRLTRGLGNAAETMLLIGPACGLVGMIIGAMNVSGIGVLVTGYLVQFAAGSTIALLLMSAALCFIMGMGMGPLIIYITLVVLVVPALIQMNINKMAAHFFIFYWGLVSLITPPVCLTSFVAAGIADSDPWETGWQATRLGIVTLILPFAFVLSPVLLLEGRSSEIILAIPTALIGASLLGVGVIGYLSKPLNWIRRVLVILSSILLIYPDWVTDLVGIALALFAVRSQLTPGVPVLFKKFRARI